MIMKHLLWEFVLIIAVFQRSSANNIKYEMLESTSQDADSTTGILSSWELFVVNDLVFQIAMKKCNQINRPAASSLKDYITDAIKQAPRQIKQQHPHFLSSYKTLMKCFDHINANSRNPGKKLESVRFIDNEQANADQKFKPDSRIEVNSNIQADFPEPPVEFVTSRINFAWQDKQGEWHWKWMSRVANAFANMFRQKREVSGESLDEEQVSRESIKKITGRTPPVEKLSDAKNNFIKILHDMNRIVQLSCPVTMKPNRSFSKKALLELAFWVSQDSHSLISASDKYFGGKSLIQDVNECLQSL